MDPDAWEYLISRSLENEKKKTRSVKLEIKQITMKELLELSQETRFGQQTILGFCRQAIEDGDSSVVINTQTVQYHVPIQEVKDFFKPETPPEVLAEAPQMDEEEEIAEEDQGKIESESEGENTDTEAY